MQGFKKIFEFNYSNCINHVDFFLFVTFKVNRNTELSITINFTYNTYILFYKTENIVCLKRQNGVF